jgi:catechol 2,3-dioxygenase-like lactoylglutathione lyase family enzyme
MKTTLLIACLMLSGAAASRTSPPAMTATGAFAAVSVRDLAASAGWYSEKLDMHVVMSVPKQNGVAVTVLEGSGLIVELIQNDAAQPLSRAAPSVKERVLVHGPFKVGAIVADFDGTVTLLRARGVEIAYGPYPARPDQRANVIVKDNEGNLIQFFGARR